MKYLRFKNWPRYQHYHDRNPPWVKLYTSILDPDSDWYGMTDAECGVLAKMLAWASRTGNAMPYNIDVIREEIHATGEVNIALFVDMEILEVCASKHECIAKEQVRIDEVLAASTIASGNASKDASENARLRDQRSEIRDQRTDSEKNPPTPRKRGAARAPVSDAVDPRVIEIVDHLNRVTGKHHSHDKGNGQIEGAIKRGATVADCCRVIDHLWATWSPEWRQRINKVTPFRKGNFDGYLDEAGAGAVKYEPPTTATEPSRVPPKFKDDDDPDLSPEERAEGLKTLEQLKGVGAWPS